MIRAFKTHVNSQNKSERLIGESSDQDQDTFFFSNPPNQESEKIFSCVIKDKTFRKTPSSIETNRPPVRWQKSFDSDQFI